MSDHVGLTRRRRFPLRAEEGENQKGIEGEISQDVFFFGGKGRGQRGVDDLDVGLVPDDGVGLGLGQLGECLNGGTWGTKLRERLKASLLEISGTGLVALGSSSPANNSSGSSLWIPVLWFSSDAASRCYTTRFALGDSDASLERRRTVSKCVCRSGAWSNGYRHRYGMIQA
jgi:hypothetical protein